MGAQDRTERVLKDIHLLFSKAEPFENSKKKVVINKSEMMDLLKELNTCMYEMQEEYELTVQSRDKANRMSQKEGEDIIFESRKNADDIYAASIMYTDRALHDIRNIIDEANADVEKILKETQEKLKRENNAVRTNQSELKSKLRGLVDTEKYMRLIEDENIRLAKEEDLKRKGLKVEAEEEDKPSYSDVTPEIKINEDYFRAQGIPIDDDEAAEPSVAESDLEAAVLSEDLDKEYFAWQESVDNKSDEKPAVSGVMKRVQGVFGKRV